MDRARGFSLAVRGHSALLPPNSEIPDDEVMPLSRKAIDDLKAIYKEHFGEDLSDDDAWEMGNRLLRVFDVLTRPLTMDDIAQKSSNGFPFDESRSHS